MMRSVGKSVIMHYTAPSFSGGVETLIGDFLKLATRLGHTSKTKLIVGKGSVDNANGIDVKIIPHLDVDNDAIRKANSLLLKGKWSSGLDDLCHDIYLNLSRHVNEGDVIHTHNIITNSFNLPLVIALHRLMHAKSDTRMIAWCHDPAWTNINLKQHNFAIYPLTLLTAVWPRTNYVVLSEERKKEIQQRIENSKVSVITPYIDIGRVLGLSDSVVEISESTGIFERDVSLLCPCRVTPRKNIELALRIICGIKDTGRSAKLLITAPPSPHKPLESDVYREKIVTLIDKYDLSDDVTLLNEMPAGGKKNSNFSQEDISGLYRLVDVVLSTSHDEGFGLAIVEAAMAGTPVLANLRSLRTLKNCGLVTPFDPAEKIENITEKALTLAGRRRARRELFTRYNSGSAYWGKLAELTG